MTETLKERLERALVPDSECPYKLPAGWNWVRGEAIFEPQEDVEPTGESFRYIDRESIDVEFNEIFDAKEILVRKAPRDARRKLHIGDTIFSMRTPGRTSIGFIDESLADCIASTDFFVCHPSELVHPRYLFLLMLSPYVLEGMAHRAKENGDDALHEEDFMQFPFPLPSLATQKEIVDAIDPIYAEANKQHRTVIYDLFNATQFLQGIYHTALSGDLTAEWRDEFDIDFADWNDAAALGDYFDVQIGCNISASENATGPKLLRLEDIDDEEVDWDHLLRCNISEKECPDAVLRLGDILIARNGRMGSERYFVREDVDAVFAADLICLSPVRPGFSAEYLEIIMKTPLFWRQLEYLENDEGQREIDLDALKEIAFSIPREKEQQEICEAVRLMTGAGEKTAKEFGENHLRWRVKKTEMLDRTFRGEWKVLAEEYITRKKTEKSVEEIVEEARSSFTGDFESELRTFFRLTEKYKDREDSHEILHALIDAFASELDGIAFDVPNELDEESDALEGAGLMN